MASDNTGIPAFIKVEKDDNGYKLTLKFEESKQECDVPISISQYQLILDGINKNFLLATSDVPSDADIGMLSGIRFMAPMESMDVIYSSPDRENRIIMVNIDPVKGVLTFYRVMLDKRVSSFDIPITWFKASKKKIDFCDVSILSDGKKIKFGQYEFNVIDLIKAVHQ